MPDLLNIALSGLITHQRALSTTGHNIANATNEGYSRQINIQATRNAEFLGGSYLGTGVDLDGVRRSVNEFIITQLRSDTSAFKQVETISNNLDRLDFLFSDSNTGLTSNQDRFYTAMQAANDDPTSIVARQVFLAEAQNMVNKFHAIEAELSRQTETMNQLIAASVSEIGGLSDQIAEVNRSIVEQSGSGFGNQPNDLLDHRDRLLKELSELVSISTIEQNDGAMNVFVGSGQAIVLGGEALTLVTSPSEFDPQVPQLGVLANGTVTKLNNELTGGILGGLLQLRSGSMVEATNSLGRIALAVSETVNQQHRLGMDLEGNLGGNFFSEINSVSAIAARTINSSSNSIPLDQVVAVSVSDLAELTTSDYRLSFSSATNYTVTRLSDGKTNAAIDPALTGTIGGLPAALTFDGLSVALSRTSGNFVAGDSFILKPTNNGAKEIALVIDRPESIALAAPVRTGANLNNLGTGTVGPGQVTDTSGALFSTTPGQLSPPLIIRFTSATTYDVLDNSGPVPVALAPPQTGLTFPPSPANAILPAGFGINLEISGQPQAGDTFTVDFNTGGYQDSRNGLAMASLQTTGVLNNGQTTLQGAYGQLLQQVGVDASQARFNLQASETLLQQSQAHRDDVSGVNLDEEAAKLIELEQAYGASAQVITVARSLFDTLLNAVGG